MKKRKHDDWDVEEEVAAPVPTCWLCDRPMGERVEMHHPVPKSRGGKAVVPVHPICHQTIHATFSTAEMAKMSREAQIAHPGITKFIAWVADKPADFHAPTKKRD